MKRNSTYVRSGYGSQALWRAYCPTCHTLSFVIDERMQCCGGPPPLMGRVQVKQMTAATPKRKTPPKYKQREILATQENRCIYCEQEFNSAHTRTEHGTEEVIILVVNWDHAEPYCFGHNNNVANFVASCRVCNGIKSGKVFESLETAREYIRTRREAKGYDF